MTPEGRVKNRLKKRLTDTFGDRCWRFMPVQTGYGSPALDFILCVAGVFVTIETKKDRCSPATPRQQTIMSLAAAAGALVFLVYDDATIDNAITEIQKEVELVQAARAYRDGKKEIRHGDQHLRSLLKS